jgi:hypothetical protein
MAVSRYFVKDGSEINMSSVIYDAVKNKRISFKKRVTKLGERLDHIAFNEYDDANYWWIIAAASGINWWLQIPDGIVLYIPTDIEEIKALKDSV